MRTHDGTDERGRALLEAATRRFGPPASWPGQFYTRNDRAGLLAEFAVDIAETARTGDTASAGLLCEAGQEAARSAIAAARTADHRDRTAGHPDHTADRLDRTAGHPDHTADNQDRTAGHPIRIALTGGVAAAGDQLVEGFRTEAGRLHPNVTIVEPAGGPLAGALTLGHLGAGGKLSAQDRVIWT